MSQRLEKMGIARERQALLSKGGAGSQGTRVTLALKSERKKKISANVSE